ncbi:DUF3883 domain-containing protein [uncultured Marixanthomonas sp.]|uniref:DUF3883 domain-containing protein n=1 Tax=uncultured Marixanthomonas sp. TaxID=757245 RepID=UPI0030DA2D5A|tara:strand:- start:128826 stop:130016 length:1191 start_codon:yes stop_codon:yes gene_type:complete
MKYKIIERYIQAYKQQFDSISKEELYKWKAVKHFQDHWDIEAEDFPSMLEESIGHTSNLLVSGNYFPAAMVIQFVRREPEKVRDAFRYAFDINSPLENRFTYFQQTMEDIRVGMTDAKSHYQDHRAFTVYLTLRYPEDYFLYKYGMFNRAAINFEFPHRPKTGAFSNITKFYNLCREIKPILLKDNELLLLHHQRLNDDTYQDPAYHLLTQDFIYACVNHIKIDNIQEDTSHKQEIEIEEFEISQFITEMGNTSFNGRQVDYAAREKRNSEIGNAAELFIYDLEKEKSKISGFNKKVIHTSIEEGDGKGYDIKSVDKNGNTVYIEVKATTGGFKTPFYITRNELEWSIKNSENYKLYRVYDFNTKTGYGKVKILNGSLKPLCKQPVNYFIKLKKNN